LRKAGPFGLGLCEGLCRAVVAHNERTEDVEDLKHLREVLTEAYPREELSLDALARVLAALDGLPAAALDGGWTFKGFTAWAQALEADAKRYRFLRNDFSVMGANIDGQHSWAYRRNFSLRGPTLDAAIDTAMGAAPALGAA